MQSNIVNLHPQQVISAASAGLRLLDLDTTLVPGNLRREVAVLEIVLQLLAGGNAILANPPQERVKSPADGPETAPPAPPTADDQTAKGDANAAGPKSLKAKRAAKK